jgi:hypothetical protein
MRNFIITLLSIFTLSVQGQSPCDNVKLYDQMIVKGDQPMFHKLKRFDVKLISDSTLISIKNEIIRYTSKQFYAQLKIKSAKIFDSSRATAWAWTHPPITDRNLNPVYYFYAVVFETAFNNTPFAFRLDFLKNGELLNNSQLGFFRKDKLNIIGCNEIVALVSFRIN